MAETQHKKKPSSTSSSRSKSSAKSGASSTKKSGSRTAAPAKKPIRREIGGIVFLILALFSGVGYFQTDAIFIHLFSNLLKGLFGYGFWVIPPAFLLTGLILLIHHGRPVRLRVACMLIAPLSIGVILQILLCKQEFTSTFGIIAALYKSGITLSSGGVVCGGLRYRFEQMISEFASVTV